MRDLVTPGGAAGIWVPSRPECMYGEVIMAEGKDMGGSQQPSAAGWLTSHCFTALFFLSYGKRGVGERRVG